MKTHVHLRFHKYVKAHKLVIEHLAKDMDVDKGSLYNYFNGKTSIPLQVLDKFIQLYPGLNVDWLLSGRGEMDMSTVENHISEPQEDYDKKCPECFKKDKLIDYFMDDNNRLKEKIDCCEMELQKVRFDLKKLIESAGQEKRKAG